ncbi:MAG: FliH/SctL family protein [bacterium]
MSAYFKPEEKARELEKRTRDRREKMLPRARVIRGGLDIEDNSEEIRKLLESLQPRAVVRGRVNLDESGEKAGVGLSYTPEYYGLSKVETVEEMQERHRSEIETLRSEIERREKEAYDRGFGEGRSKGHEEGVGEVKEEFEKHVELLLSMLKSTAEQTKHYFVDVEERLVEFAMHIARRIVGDSAEHYREVAVKLAGEAIKQATDRTTVILRCNSNDVQQLEAAKGDLLAISEGIREIEIIPSPRIESGGVILETASGSIDATIGTMLNELHQALLPDHMTSEGEGSA